MTKIHNGYEEMVENIPSKTPDFKSFRAGIADFQVAG
jgi:hypothetical protein